MGNRKIHNFQVSQTHPKIYTILFRCPSSYNSGSPEALLCNEHMTAIAMIHNTDNQHYFDHNSTAKLFVKERTVFLNYVFYLALLSNYKF